jgi:two-component system, OmpR family, sensor histidine kinase KdpD
VHIRGWGIVEVIAALAATTAVVWILELGLGLERASALYLLAVAIIAIRQGTTAALLTALGAFVIYNLLFVEPRFTLAVARPEELITLFLLLFVGIVIGRLGGAQRERERLAAQREREARALFAISRELATAPRVTDAIGTVLERVRADAGMTRAWVGVGSTIAGERPLGDTGGPRTEPVGTHSVLQRDRPEDSATWVRIHTGSTGRGGGSAMARYRVALVADRGEIGSLWSERPSNAGPPTLEETRLLAATADQVAQAVRRDRLAAAAADAEIERRSDELRSALLDSVSHDLRTPLATIRAAAGSLADPAIELDEHARRATARAIDDEAERMNRLVDSLLDMSRIQSGALATDLEVTPLTELLDPILERYRPRVTGPLTVTIPDDLPAVHVDQTFLSQALSNVFDNAVTHSTPGAEIAVSASALGDDVEVRVEDSAPGVSADALPRLFDRFYRAPAVATPSRRGVGLGLTVVRGLVEAMGGTVRASASDLGGLAITIRVPAAPAEPEAG